MKIAYLIIAHHQPLMLKKLVDALSADGASFFIHIDDRSDFNKFSEIMQNTREVYFTERKKVNWMGFSIVGATLVLMHLATQFQRYDYYCLLSGSDYPIKSNEHIFEFFRNKNTEYINFWKLEDRPSWLHKIQHYYFTDIFSIRDFYSRKLTLGDIYWRFFHKLKDIFPKRKYLHGIVPYGGSQWWSLTHECVTFILDYLNMNPAFLDFYRYTHSPDEMFFQTIIMNSKFAESTQNYFSYQLWSNETSQNDKNGENKMLAEDSFNIRYIDWSGGVNMDRDKPAILDDRDYIKLKTSLALFARKFDFQKSRQLLQMIDDDLSRQI